MSIGTFQNIECLSFVNGENYRLQEGDKGFLHRCKIDGANAPLRS
jgi:hypothetical protein